MNKTGSSDPTAEKAIGRASKERRYDPKTLYKKFCTECPELAKRCKKFTTSPMGNQIILTMDNNVLLRFIVRKTGWRLESYGF